MVPGNASPPGRWSQSAATYSELSPNLTIYQLSNQVLARRAGLEPDAEIVDLGCGSGSTTLAAFRVQPGLRHVWAVDQSAAMLDHARRALRAKPVTFVQAAAASFSASLDGRRVDRVISNAAFFHFQQRQQVLAEIRKILRPEGMFGFTLPGPHDGPGRFELAAAVTAALSPRRPAPLRRPVAALRPRRAPEIACTYESVRQVLAQAGFGVLSSEFLSYRLSPEEIARWMLLPAFRPAEWAEFTAEELTQTIFRVLASRSSTSTFSWNLILARPGQQRSSFQNDQTSLPRLR